MWDPVWGLVQEGKVREYTVFCLSLRMALVITLHHKYIQLSGSNHALPIHSRIGVVIMLTLELCLSIILEIHMRIFALRQCADYAHVSYAGAGEARVARVTFAVGRPEKLFGVRYPSRDDSNAPSSLTSISITVVSSSI